MRRLSTLLLAAALVLGASISASAATEFSIKGYSDVTFDYSSGLNIDKATSNDPFFAAQQSEFNLGFQNGDVKAGLTFLILGKWGSNIPSTGFSLGTDGVNMKTRFAWLDFKIPSTDAAVRLGLQSLSLPNSLPGQASIVMNTMHSAGVTLNAPINDMISVTAFWNRLIDQDVTSSGSGVSPIVDGKSNHHDELDVFGLTMPIRYQNYFTATPWVMAGQFGRDIVTQGQANQNVTAGPSKRAFANLTPVYNPANVENYRANTNKQSTPIWAGLPVSLLYFDPLIISADFNYGDNGLKHSNQRSGWYAAAMASYKFSRVTPSLMFWYGSGDDNNPANGSEMIPTFVGVNSATSYGFGMQSIRQSQGLAFATSLAGTWGVRLQLADFSFIQKLNHTLKFAYYTGTSSSSAQNVKALAASPIWGGVGVTNTYLTKKDSVFELNFINTYELYDNLVLKANFNVLAPKFSNKVWNDFQEETIYNLAIGASYTF